MAFLFGCCTKRAVAATGFVGCNGTMEAVPKYSQLTGAGELLLLTEPEEATSTAMLATWLAVSDRLRNGGRLLDVDVMTMRMHSHGLLIDCGSRIGPV